MSYKWRDPRTGKPVPATVFYKIKKALRRRATVTERMRDIKEQQAMARRGISPQTTEQIQAMREARLKAQSTIQAMPTQPIQNGRATQAEIQQEVSEIPEGYHIMPDGRMVRGVVPSSQLPTQKYKVVTDILTGRKIIKPIPQRERWTQ
jgi:hypothetical protein